MYINLKREKNPKYLNVNLNKTLDHTEYLYHHEIKKKN